MANQTISFLMRRFAEVGIYPKTKHGQNFLIDLNLLNMLADSAKVEANDVVLEIGTGTGSLTSRLADRAAAVVTVELDPQMHLLASEELIDYSNITMLQMDALKNKNTLSEVVLDTVREQLAVDPNRRFILAANLPYNIATPILSNLLACDLTPATMTVTIQKELADRIMAVPCTKDYSSLSVWMQSQCEIELVRIMSPTVFWPRPKVHSAILHITLREELRDRIHDRAFFHDFVRSMFFHRRKFLRGELLAALKHKLGKVEVDEIMQTMEFGTTTRAEELDVPTMIRLSETVKARLDAAAQ